MYILNVKLNPVLATVRFPNVATLFGLLGASPIERGFGLCDATSTGNNIGLMDDGALPDSGDDLFHNYCVHYLPLNSPYYRSYKSSVAHCTGVLLQFMP